MMRKTMLIFSLVGLTVLANAGEALAQFRLKIGGWNPGISIGGGYGGLDAGNGYYSNRGYTDRPHGYRTR